MRLDDLDDAVSRLDLPTAAETAHPERSVVKTVRDAVETAIVDDEFVVDCIDHELDVIASGRVRRGLVPFHAVPQLGVRLAFGYWPPGTTPGPHEHTAWTVTAVCRNELRVDTYDRAESYRHQRLVPKHQFDAPQGRTGYIFEPAIHAPHNPSNAWSLSFHVTSPRDGERLEDADSCPPELEQPPATLDRRPHPYWEIVRRRQQLGTTHFLAVVLASTRLPSATAPLLDCSRLGASATRRLVARVCRGRLHEVAPTSPLVLRRTSPLVELRTRRVDGAVHLESATPSGIETEMIAGGFAGRLLEHAIASERIDLDLPRWGLDDDERDQFGDALEQTGLFVREDAWP